jgi:hypothetical protein
MVLGWIDIRFGRGSKEVFDKLNPNDSDQQEITLTSSLFQSLQADKPRFPQNQWENGRQNILRDGRKLTPLMAVRPSRFMIIGDFFVPFKWANFLGMDAFCRGSGSAPCAGGQGIVTRRQFMSIKYFTWD